MKKSSLLTRVITLAVGLAGLTLSNSHASPDPTYDPNDDLVLYFINRFGTTGTNRTVAFSLGSSTQRFRAAATPGDPLYGTTLYLGNLNGNLTAAYGSDWTSLSTNSSLWAAAVAANGNNTHGFSTATINQDYARTIYATKPRLSPGIYQQPNNTSLILPNGAGSQGALADNISGVNNVAFANSNNTTANPVTVQYITQNQGYYSANPFPNSPNIPGTAWDYIQGGVVGRLNPNTYTYGTITNVVLGMDLFRATPVLNNDGWQNINNIPGVVAKEGYYLGTILLSQNGDVNFVAVPEPSTFAFLACGGLLALAFLRIKPNQNSKQI